MRKGCLTLALAAVGLLAHTDAKAQRLDTLAQREQAVLDAGRQQAADPEQRRRNHEIRRANDEQLLRERQRREPQQREPQRLDPTRAGRGGDARAAAGANQAAASSLQQEAQRQGDQEKREPQKAAAPSQRPEARQPEAQAGRAQAVLDAGRQQAADPERQRLYREIRHANDAQLLRERQQREHAPRKQPMASPTPMPARQQR